jgi:hypothetical protein
LLVDQVFSCLFGFISSMVWDKKQFNWDVAPLHHHLGFPSIGLPNRTVQWMETPQEKLLSPSVLWRVCFYGDPSTKTMDDGAFLIFVIIYSYLRLLPFNLQYCQVWFIIIFPTLFSSLLSLKSNAPALFVCGLFLCFILFYYFIF